MNDASPRAYDSVNAVNVAIAAMRATERDDGASAHSTNLHNRNPSAAMTSGTPAQPKFRYASAMKENPSPPPFRAVPGSTVHINQSEGVPRAVAGCTSQNRFGNTVE